MTLSTYILTLLVALLIPSSGHARQIPLLSAHQGPNATALREHALSLMSLHPLIDTHVDLPMAMRSVDRRPMGTIPRLKPAKGEDGFPGHVDIPRMREGRMGGIFLTVWAPCSAGLGQDPGVDFLTPTDTLRDTLETLDLIQETIAQHPQDLEFAQSSLDVERAFSNGRMAALIAIEGAHHLGNTLSSIRLFAQLGVKYLTLTHTCHNAFASSAGDGSPIDVVHPGNGLSALGRELIPELNRLGVMVDLSHVSDETMRQSISLSCAPVIFSHSGARVVHDHVRNVPDDVLRMIGSGEGQNRGIVLSVFYPPFIDPVEPTVRRLVDHIEHIAGIVGKGHVGLGSDFDGMYSSLDGLEDASKYPHLIMELLSRGWTDPEVVGFMGGNLLRVMDEVDAVKANLTGRLPSTAVWEPRKDLPARWGGPDDAYLPTDLKQYLRRVRDEL